MNSDVVVAVLLLIAAAIHLPPVLGVLGVAGMERAYATTINGPDLAVLMRHRAVLFGVLGSLLVWAAFDEDLRWPAIAAGLTSDVAFALLCWSHRDHGPKIGNVLKADLVSIAVLASASVVVLVAQA